MVCLLCITFVYIVGCKIAHVAAYLVVLGPENIIPVRTLKERKFGLSCPV